MDICYGTPEQYIAAALRLMIEFRRYKMQVGAAMTDFYLLLRAAILKAKVVGHLKLLINKQTSPAS
jgi:hypothetical protein